MAKQETNFNWRDFKGTPGEWEMRSNTPYDTGGWVVFSGRKENNKTIVRLPFGNTVPVDKNEAYHENLSNAKLIAAAPQMHQLLNEFICQGMKDKPNQELVFEVTAKAQQLLIDIND